VPECQLDHGDVACGAPPLSDERLAAHIIIEQIERLVHSLLLAHEVLPAEEALSDLAELRPARAAGVEQRHFEVLDATVYLAQRVDALVCVRVDGVDGRTEGLGHPADLGKQCVAVRKDDEHVLVGRAAGRSVDEGVNNVGVVHVKIATEDTPEHALERWQTSAVDNAGDEPRTKAKEEVNLEGRKRPYSRSS
jgi:hypothetical protein